MKDDLMSISEAAKYLNLTNNQMEYLRRKRRIVGYIVNPQTGHMKYKKKDLDNYRDRNSPEEGFE